MKNIFLLLLLLILCSPTTTRAQLGMGGQPHPSAVLDLKSPANDKAFYPPRLTTAQRNAMANPQAGAFVYDPEKGTIFLYDGQSWLPLATTDASLLAPITRTASDGAANDFFGRSVAIAGDYAIVGAPFANGSNSTERGSAYIFVRSGNNWVEQAKLTPSDGVSTDWFGSSVAISGDYAIVGAPHGSTLSPAKGKAYVFVRTGSTWTQQAILTASDGTVSDNFGGSVGISGNYAVVSASGSDLSSNGNQGAAYIFRLLSPTLLATWSQQAKITASDATIGASFGTSVAISGDYVIVGVAFATISGNTSQGAAYMFLRTGSTWAQQAKITATDGAIGDLFGFSVAISGDYAVIGAFYDDGSLHIDQGSAYVFLRTGSTWAQQAKLIDSDGAADDEFGNSVTISGDYILIGAPHDRIGSNYQQGAAHLFMRNGTSWTRLRKITDNSPERTYNGASVGLSNGTFVIGGSGFQNGKGKVAFGTVD